MGAITSRAFLLAGLPLLFVQLGLIDRAGLRRAGITLSGTATGLLARPRAQV